MISKSVSLSAEGVSYTYPKGARALAGVEILVEAGRLTAVAGPNGSGKSTLLRVLAGLIHADKGSIEVDGTPLAALERSERARLIGFLPQQVEMTFELTAGQVIMSGRFPHLGVLGLESEKDVSIVRAIMKQTATEAFADRPMSTLSGGERQRVLIGSVLAQQPAILLLDEPTSALDIRYQVEIYSMLRRLAGEGMAVAVVTHDLNLAAEFAHTIYLLFDGKVAASGDASEVIRKEVLEPIYQIEIAVGSNPVTLAPTVFPIRPDTSEREAK